MRPVLSLEERIVRLERSRGRLQAAITVILLLVGVGAMMGQTSANQTITAREIALVDQNGRVTAKINSGPLVLPGEAALEVTDGNGQHMLSLTRLGDATTFAVNPPFDLTSKESKGFGGFAVMTTPTVTSASIFQNSSKVDIFSTREGAEVAIGGVETSHLRVAVQPPTPPLVQNPTVEQLAEQLRASLSRSIADQKTAVDVSATAKDASLAVSDGQGFEAQLGNANLQIARTGQTSRTSAASLLLLGSDRGVLWRAP